MATTRRSTTAQFLACATSMRKVGVRSRSGFRPGSCLGGIGYRRDGSILLPVCANAFNVRNDGNVAGRLTGSYDLLLSQRWIVQPEAELNFYSKDDPGRRIGSVYRTWMPVCVCATRSAGNFGHT